MCVGEVDGVGEVTHHSSPGVARGRPGSPREDVEDCVPRLGGRGGWGGWGGSMRGWMRRWIGRWMGGWEDRGMHGRMGGCIDGLMLVVSMFDVGCIHCRSDV